MILPRRTDEEVFDMLAIFEQNESVVVKGIISMPYCRALELLGYSVEVFQERILQF